MLQSKYAAAKLQNENVVTNATTNTITISKSQRHNNQPKSKLHCTNCSAAIEALCSNQSALQQLKRCRAIQSLQSDLIAAEQFDCCRAIQSLQSNSIAAANNSTKQNTSFFLK